MKWTLTANELPPMPEDEFRPKSYLVTISHNRVIAVKYVKTTIRKKEVVRWEWQGRVCHWEVIAWMPFPEPYVID